MKDPTGGNAPAGGFKDLGWYNSYQYYGGTFAPRAGMIHPSSPQQGAGQGVSAEVNRQSSVAAGKAPDAYQQYINQQNNGNPLAIGTGSGIPGSGGGSGAGAGVGYASPEVLNLPKLYDNMYANSGIANLEADLSAKEKTYIDAQSAINDNPWLSEASRTGRQDKLTTDYEKRVANIRNDVQTRKADIEMKLNLETKQFDINSQAAQQSLERFNILLQNGALENASGEDIANITRSTGLSSQAILSAVESNRKKNIQTSVIQFDDGQSQGFAVIDQMGNIVNKQVIGASKPAASGGGSGTLSETRAFDLEVKQAPMIAAQDARSGVTFTDMLKIYQGYLTNQQIYQIYNGANYYKRPADITSKQAKSLGIKK